MKGTKYKAKQPDERGFIAYTDEEHDIWHVLMKRQLELIQGRACQAFLDGVEQLQLPEDRIPQLSEISATLQTTTGWGVARVPALISFDRFFSLLANKQFPVATFIRCREELDYLEEPDIFHEIFGHCPLLTDPDFAAFTANYGRLGLAATKEERVYLARLYWLTVEFGLLNSSSGLKIYGGGILSSYGETRYALESNLPVREPFDLMRVLRTPYRIDILQPLYYIIDSLAELQALCSVDIMKQVHRAMEAAPLPALFDPASD